ncbi:hypothetical protein L2E82_30531 [Cichorium intybus]|uniref:Uncharacterized protein n=1 Tax=Cichorium intybus TaxID=13427 RepID=A0ACB9D1B8_CICIN|nr:hypothetical protein L2E82_30531 [Cichorium intybus]
MLRSAALPVNEGWLCGSGSGGVGGCREQEDGRFLTNTRYKTEKMGEGRHMVGGRRSFIEKQGNVGIEVGRSCG